MIESYRFGSYIIDGKEYRWDIKIVDKKVKSWEDRSGHNLKLKDIDDLIEANPDYIVIGTGASGLVKVSDQIREAAAKDSIKLIIEKTPFAVKDYNDLEKKGKKVCAIFHGTC